MGSQEGRKAVVSGEKAFAGAVTLMVVVTVVVALYFAGSPATERSRRLDDQRISDLQAVTYSIDAFYASAARVPKGLEELNDSAAGRYHGGSVVDPISKVQYEYITVSNGEYQLCAMFDLSSAEAAEAIEPPSAKPYPSLGGDWTHPAGYHCFNIDAATRVPRATCSITNPCAAGQNCVTLSDGKGAVCVPSGKECLAAGCLSGQCVIAESYPAQVRCTE